MRRRSTRPAPDVFEAFAHRVEDDDEAGTRVPPVATMARSAGITVFLMVLTSLAFVAGAWLGGRHLPELDYSNLLWEGVAIAAWCLAWGTFTAMAVLALGILVVGVPWARRQRARATSTSSP